MIKKKYSKRFSWILFLFPGFVALLEMGQI